ncbi:MAG: asparagine synthetase B [Bacteroidales bacterium]|nr:asparagine synthetase B [Bacteroidales bacterium]MBR6277346.1 asparagine synthetase B [Bacteroidales bacterium]
MNKILLTILLFLLPYMSFGLKILIPMDEAQTNHLKAYGVCYAVLEKGGSAQWLLNYRGGSFLTDFSEDIAKICRVRNVKFEQIADAAAEHILLEISQNDVNMEQIKLEKAPKIAVYAPKTYKPWDDAVMLVLTYAEIPYTVVYDEEILTGELSKYDWLHVHHEDFTGQFGKFYAMYKNAPWYKNQVTEFNALAQKMGFNKVSQLKLAVAKTMKEFVGNGGFMFAMCSATDSFDIALAAEGVDICQPMFDGDPIDPDCQKKLDFSKTFAFKDFTLELNPNIYEYSDIDATRTRRVTQDNDIFTLFDFSAKWDPVPTMLCQNHVSVIDGFMGQTTAYNKKVLKSSVLIMGENKAANEARYIHGEYEKGTWTWYAGHDPEDYTHYVGDKPTDLDLHPNSPGFRLILNNVLFPAAKKKKMKT